MIGRRCKGCGMRPVLCVCGEIPKLETDVHLVVLVHAFELRSTTNTGLLAARAFPSHEVRVRGLKDAPMDTTGLVTRERQPLLLYPSADAEVLSPALVRRFERPITLIVPDGTWRQASKVAKREAWLEGVPRVKLPEGAPTGYHLRLAPGANCMSTLEAISRAMGVIEGPQAEDALARLFKLVVERTLWSRGQLPLAQCVESIPAAAIEEVYTSGAAGRARACQS